VAQSHLPQLTIFLGKILKLTGMKSARLVLKMTDKKNGKKNYYDLTREEVFGAMEKFQKMTKKEIAELYRKNPLAKLLFHDFINEHEEKDKF